MYVATIPWHLYEERIGLLHRLDDDETIEIVIENWDSYLHHCVDEFLTEQQFKHNEHKYSQLSQIRIRHLFPQWYWTKWGNDVLEIFTSLNFIHLMDLVATNNTNMEYLKGSMKLVVDILIEFIDVEDVKRQIDISAYNAICKHLLSSTNIYNIDTKTNTYSTIECILFSLITLLKIYNYHFPHHPANSIEHILCVINAICLSYHCYLKVKLMHSQYDLFHFLQNYLNYQLDQTIEIVHKHNASKSKCAVFDEFTSSLTRISNDVSMIKNWTQHYKLLQLIVIESMLSAVVWLLSFKLSLFCILSASHCSPTFYVWFHTVQYRICNSVHGKHKMAISVVLRFVFDVFPEKIIWKMYRNEAIFVFAVEWDVPE